MAIGHMIWSISPERLNRFETGLQNVTRNRILANGCKKFLLNIFEFFESHFLKPILCRFC